MKLIIDIPDEIVKKGFEGPLTDEERMVIIRAVGNATQYKEPQGDTISREALRKAFHERIWYFDKSSWDEANALIDNAPTVKPCDNCDLYFKAMTKEEMQKGGAE